MARGKGAHIAAGVLVLLLTAGSASARVTFPICLPGADVPPWMTSSHTFDPILTVARVRARSSAPGTFLSSMPQNQADMMTIDDPSILRLMSQEISVGNDCENGPAGFRGAAYQVPSPGTLLLGAMGAFLVGALRMRRML